METWKEYRLDEFIEFNPSIPLKKGVKASKISMDKIVPNCRQVISDETAPYEGGMKFQNYDTIMARITPCLENGKCAFINGLQEGEIAFGSTEYFVLRARPAISDPMFVYYLAISPEIKDVAIQSMTGTSGRQRAQIDVLQNYVKALPKITEQQHIAAILSSLDDKIELNRRINDNLEQQAQALFKSWFVDFEPFKDGKFVESELGMIPEGWKIDVLGSICDVVGGGTPSKANSQYYCKDGIPWITPKDLSNTHAKFTFHGELDISESGYSNSSAKKMPQGTVLFSSRAPIGYISIASNELCTNQGFKSLVPQIAGTCYLYLYLKANVGNIEAQATGSTFKEVSGSLMKAQSVVIPKETNLLDNFEMIVNPLFNCQEMLESENRKLTQLRDILLPKLMSGSLNFCE